MNQIRMFEAFAGIGAMSKALKRKGVPVKLVGYSEIDKYASKSFAAVHGVDESLNFGDITKIDEKDKRLKNLDLFTYGFPCQDISIAGKQNGMTLETRSGLLFEALRIIQHNMPKVCIAENVKNLVSKKFKAGFESMLAELEFYGYNNYWKVLNGLEYGIPQQRERVIIVSIRKDVDDGTFQFGESLPLNLYVSDIFEKIVDEKYYDIENWLLPLERISPKDFKVYEATKAGYAMATIGDTIDINYPNSTTRRGRVGKGIAKTLDTKPDFAYVTVEGRLRRYIPQECWQLMGFTKEDYLKARSIGIPETNLYKQAGNSIIVDVLEHGVFKYLYKET